MKAIKWIIFLTVVSLLTCSLGISQPFDSILPRIEVQAFINKMVLEHQFNSLELNQLFAKVSLKKAVVRKLKHPYEEHTWNIYKGHFISNGHIEQGVKFWRKHESVLNEAYRKYGVPPEIIVAITGIETKYGRQLGNYRVIDALSTLAFQNTLRSDFFQMELSQFLIYCRQNDIDPLSIYGSYAGAFGIPQFMPSSVMTFAVSSSRSGKIDLMHNTNDAILSIANFLHIHGWKRGYPIVMRAVVKSSTKVRKLQHSFQQPNLVVGKLSRYGLVPAYHISPKTLFGVFILHLKHHQQKYWLGFGNYYVIRTYNQSFQYAMAVYTLSRDIVNARSK